MYCTIVQSEQLLARQGVQHVCSMYRGWTPTSGPSKLGTRDLLKKNLEQERALGCQNECKTMAHVLTHTDN